MRGSEAREACGASSDARVPTHCSLIESRTTNHEPRATNHEPRTTDQRWRSISAGASVMGFSADADFACLSRSATNASRLWSSSLRGRRPFVDPTAYSQNSGKPIVESTYATTVSGSTPGLTLPQLTASAGVAPESPPQTT